VNAFFIFVMINRVGRQRSARFLFERRVIVDEV